MPLSAGEPSRDPNEAPSSNNTVRRTILLVIWIGFLFSLGFYSLIAATIADNRRESGILPPAAAAGGPGANDPIALLPYLLPVALLVAGLWAYRRIALRVPQEEQQRTWAQVQSGFIVMLAIFEINGIVGLVFLLLGGTIGEFFAYATGTFLLLCVGFWQLVSTWPRAS